MVELYVKKVKRHIIWNGWSNRLLSHHARFYASELIAALNKYSSLQGLGLSGVLCCPLPQWCKCHVAVLAYFASVKCLYLFVKFYPSDVKVFV